MTDNQNKVINFLDWLRRKEEEAAPLAPYQAYTLNTPQKDSSMMKIEYGDERISLLRKSYFVRCTLTADSQYLSMFFSSCIITMQGQHLDQIAHLLKYDEIRSLYCFNPKLHDMPPEGEVIITAIHRENTEQYYF